jgi:hypothetical protein
MSKSDCAKAPCKSCPYRKDVPSGVWAASEYDKLPLYDGTIIEQIIGGGSALFMCHQNDGKLCAGWVAAHGPENLVALRLHRDKVDPSVFDYKSPVPVFGSGEAASKHGKRSIRRPGKNAQKTIVRLLRRRELGL